MRHWIATAVTFATLAAATPALAATKVDTKAYDALIAMKSMSVITLGDYVNNGNGDVEGRLWVGGNASGSAKLQVGYGNGSQSVGQSLNNYNGTAAAYKTMTVIGNFTGNGVDLSNGATSNGTTSANGNYGVTIGGNFTDSNNGLGIKNSGAVVTIGGYLNRLNVDGGGAKVTVGGNLNNASVNGSNAVIKSSTYTGYVNSLGSGSTVSVSGSNPSGNTPPAGWAFNQSGQSLADAVTTSQLANDKATMVANMTDLTGTLAAMTTTGASFSKIGAGGTSTDYDLLFNVTGTANGYSVLNISATDLLNARNIGFTFGNGVSSSAPVVINVTGLGSGTWNWNLQGGNSGIYNSSLSSSLVWNLVGATGTMNLNKQLEGSIISTAGTITTTNGSANIEGTVVAQVFNQGGEVHLGSFNGGDTGNAAITNMVTTGAVPETQTWITMILGFGFIGAVIRRQKQQVMLLRL